MALTYLDNPVDHAFDYSKKAALGINREPGNITIFKKTLLVTFYIVDMSINMN